MGWVQDGCCSGEVWGSESDDERSEEALEEVVDVAEERCESERRWVWREGSVCCRVVRMRL
jgi:hypothetical protein